METVRPLVKESKLPVGDLCQILNIVVKLSSYYPDQSDPSASEQDLVPGFRKNHEKFIFEMLGRIRHSVYDIPQEHFALTMANLVEYEHLIDIYREAGQGEPSELQITRGAPVSATHISSKFT